MTCIKAVLLVYFAIFYGFVSAYKAFNVKGLVPVVFTPYDPDGQVNCSAIAPYAQYLKENGVSGALVCGTASEGPGLGLKERIALLDAWLEAARPLDLKVVMQVGGMPMPEVLELARYAEMVKPDAILTLPELYFKPPNVDALVRYITLISKEAPSLPILYYDHPSLSGVNLNMAKLFGQASKSIPNFMGIKGGLLAAVDIDAENDVREEQKIFIATHAIRAPACLLGHNSSMSAISNIFPRLMLDIDQAVQNNDNALANQLQRELNRKVATIVANSPYVPSVKAALEVISGINLGNVRDPITPLTDEQKQHISMKIQEMQP